MEIWVFDKTDAQWWNKSHMHYGYVTMRSICCHGDKSLTPKSQSVIGDWFHITRITMVMLRILCACREGDGAMKLIKKKKMKILGVCDHHYFHWPSSSTTIPKSVFCTYVYIDICGRSPMVWRFVSWDIVTCCY